MGLDIQTYIIDRFYGLATNYADTAIHPGHAHEAVDIDWRDSKGGIKGAKSHTLHYDRDASVLNMYIYNNYPFYTLASTCYYKDTIVKLGGSTDWGGTSTFTDIDGMLIGANGGKLVKFDGTYLYQLGVSVPTVGSFAAAGTGSGSFTVGNWSYKVTFVNSNDIEGNASSSILASNQGTGKAKCALTNIPTGDPEEGIKARRIYRTTSGGSIYYLLATINDNTTTTYDDTTTDANLGTSVPPIDHNKPTGTCSIVASVGTRLFIAGDTTYPRRLWYSLPVPYYECFPGTYYDDFASDIIALCPLGDILLVLTENGPVIFANLDDVSLMRQYPMSSRIMASSPHGATTKNNEAYWIGPQGGFVTSGVTVDEFTQQILGLFPTNVSAGGLGFDTYGTLYIILNYGAFSSNYGKIVDLEWTGLTSSFSSEYGKIVRISSSDTWTFTSEYGRVVGISVGGDRPASTIVRTQRGDDIIWSLDSDQVNCIAHNPAERQTYIGKDDGVYKAFNGDRKNWVWQSVYSSLGMPAHRKQLHKVRIRCSGTVVVAIYTDDDVLIHSETITNDAMQVSDIVMPPASWGYTFSIRLEGSTDGVVEPPVVYWFTPEVL